MDEVNLYKAKNLGIVLTLTKTVILMLTSLLKAVSFVRPLSQSEFVVTVRLVMANLMIFGECHRP